MKFNINEAQIYRLVVIVLFALFVSVFTPEVAFGELATLTNPTITIIIYVFIAGFLISEAMGRNRQLDSAVSVEVSRLRRSAHLLMNMGFTKANKDALRGLLIGYFSNVATNDFKEYDKGHEQLTHYTRAIYGLKPKTRRDEILYAEMLEVTRDAAYQRQQVAHLMRSYANPYIWLILVIIIVISIVLLLASREPHFTSQLFIGGTIAGLLLILDLLYEEDFLTRSRKRWYQARYARSAKALREEYGNGKSSK